MGKKKNKDSKKSNIIIYILLILILLVLYARYIEPMNLFIKEYKIESKDIPKNFDGIKIVHFSDIHYGRTVDNRYLEKIVDMINKQKPDIVIYTGDFIDEDINLSDKKIAEINKILNKIDSTLGNYAVAGNHDMKYFSNYKKILDNNFTLLDNQQKILYYKDNEAISLIGLADSLESTINYEILNKESMYYTFVICHEPDEFDKIKKYDFDVMLSGHSHNGQIRAPFIGTIATPPGAKKYYDEHYSIDNKEIFISNGIGTSGINLRFMSRPSISLYRLYSE